MKDHGDQSGILLLNDGLDAFVGRALPAEKAERSIDVQYYMFHQDTVGQLLIRSLISAADRGVRVRMLIDDMYGEMAKKPIMSGQRSTPTPTWRSGCSTHLFAEVRRTCSSSLGCPMLIFECTPNRSRLITRQP